MLIVPPREVNATITARDAVLTSINYHTIHRRLLHASKDVVLQAYKDTGIKVKDP